MLLQTNSYLVPAEKRAEHARLMRRFRQALLALGCDHFEVYEQAGPGWSTSERSGRFVQMMRFRSRRQQQEVQERERQDPAAQEIIAEFCELINFPYQQQQGLFATGFYHGVVGASSLPDDPQEEYDDGNYDEQAPDRHGQASGNGEAHYAEDAENAAADEPDLGDLDELDPETMEPPVEQADAPQEYPRSRDHA